MSSVEMSSVDGSDDDSEDGDRGGLSKYEIERLATMQRNQAVLVAMGIDKVKLPKKQPKKREKVANYAPLRPPSARAAAREAQVLASALAKKEAKTFKTSKRRSCDGCDGDKDYCDEEEEGEEGEEEEGEEEEEEKEKEHVPQPPAKRHKTTRRKEKGTSTVPQPPAKRHKTTRRKEKGTSTGQELCAFGQQICIIPISIDAQRLTVPPFVVEALAGIMSLDYESVGLEQEADEDGIIDMRFMAPRVGRNHYVRVIFANESIPYVRLVTAIAYQVCNNFSTTESIEAKIGVLVQNMAANEWRDVFLLLSTNSTKVLRRFVEITPVMTITELVEVLQKNTFIMEWSESVVLSLSSDAKKLKENQHKPIEIDLRQQQMVTTYKSSL